VFLKEHLNLTKSQVSERKREEYREKHVEDEAKREKSLVPLRALHPAAYYDH